MAQECHFAFFRGAFDNEALAIVERVPIASGHAKAGSVEDLGGVGELR